MLPKAQALSQAHLKDLSLLFARRCGKAVVQALPPASKECRDNVHPALFRRLAQTDALRLCGRDFYIQMHAHMNIYQYIFFYMMNEYCAWQHVCMTPSCYAYCLSRCMHRAAQTRRLLRILRIAHMSSCGTVPPQCALRQRLQQSSRQKRALTLQAARRFRNKIVTGKNCVLR